MSLMIYSQYTKPEGSIKFDDLVLNAKKKKIKELALTDHGNLSGIIEFYTKCLDFGIKPIIGLDFFCRLKNNKFVRIILYIKNHLGYKNTIRIVQNLKHEKNFFYCDLEDIDHINNCFICLSVYKTDIISEDTDLETDFSYINRQFSALDVDRTKLFYHILFSENPYNRSVTDRLKDFSSHSDIKLLAAEPVYYLNEFNSQIKDFTARISGFTNTVRYDGQYLGSIQKNLSKYPEDSIRNMRLVTGRCNFLIEDIPVKFPKLEINNIVGDSSFYSLKLLLKDLTAKKTSEIKKMAEKELAFVRKYNICDIIMFLIEVKKEYYKKYNKTIFFSGFIDDLHIAYLCDLTLSSPVFAGKFYHRSVLATKKIHPQITVIVSPEQRRNLFEYLSERFSKNSICFLSEYVRWYIPSILSVVKREYRLDQKLSDELLLVYNKNSRYNFNTESVLSHKIISEMIRSDPGAKDIIDNILKLNDSFKNYSTNTNQLVISDENIADILPVRIKDEKALINTSSYNIQTAKHFGVWNINIESNNYIDIREYFGLRPLFESGLVKGAPKLIDHIKNNVLEMIPYFNYVYERLKFLRTCDNDLWNLLLYLESSHSDLEFIFDRASPAHPRGWYKKELEVTRGFIVFREQLHFICDKLFTSKDMIILKRRLANSSGRIQFNSILSQVEEKYSENCEYLKQTVMNTVFSLSLSESVTKLVTALRTLDLIINNKKEFTEYIFSREVNSQGQWKKYLPVIVEQGYIFNRYSIGLIAQKIYIKNNRVTMPLYSIKGISLKVSEYIYELVNNNKIFSFPEFLSAADNNILKQNHIELLIQTGFFDIFDSNRKKIEILNEKYFRSIRDADYDQPELFDTSGVEMSTAGLIADYTPEEKKKLEYDHTGIVFTFNDELICTTGDKFKDLEDILTMPRSLIADTNMILHLSINSSDRNILSDISDHLADQGNCEVEIFFSDEKRFLKLDKKIQLDQLTVYKLKILLEDSPVFIETKKEKGGN
ncbi:MAG: PHP domain-containing protein [Candidatus Delongbacteria bacterium]